MLPAAPNPKVSAEINELNPIISTPVKETSISALIKILPASPVLDCDVRAEINAPSCKDRIGVSILMVPPVPEKKESEEINVLSSNALNPFKETSFVAVMNISPPLPLPYVSVYINASLSIRRVPVSILMVPAFPDPNVLVDIKPSAINIVSVSRMISPPSPNDGKAIERITTSSTVRKGEARTINPRSKSPALTARIALFGPPNAEVPIRESSSIVREDVWISIAPPVPGPVFSAMMAEVNPNESCPERETSFAAWMKISPPSPIPLFKKVTICEPFSRRRLSVSISMFPASPSPVL
ncbi:MAG: hypothetical protein IIA62_02180 [Nitrospinae bacterium]|nr:hypothetical protein [Nitrospinota bacterium]